jgi:hypothetical protein
MTCDLCNGAGEIIVEGYREYCPQCLDNLLCPICGEELTFRMIRKGGKTFSQGFCLYCYWSEGQKSEWNPTVKY